MKIIFIKNDESTKNYLDELKEYIYEQVNKDELIKYTKSHLTNEFKPTQYIQTVESLFGIKCNKDDYRKYVTVKSGLAKNLILEKEFIDEIFNNHSQEINMQIENLFYQYLDNQNDFFNDLSFDIRFYKIYFPLVNDSSYDYRIYFKKIQSRFEECHVFTGNLCLDTFKCFFKECTFYETYTVSNSITFMSKYLYYQCKFKENVRFKPKTNMQSGVFSNCLFQKKLLASYVIFEEQLFCNDITNPYKKMNEIMFVFCNFKKDFIPTEIDRGSSESFLIDKLILDESTFYNKVKILQCTISEVSFYNTTFKDLADFYRSEFTNGNLNNYVTRDIFEKTDFEGITVFSKAIFKCNINFKYTKFLSNSIFRETEFREELDLKDAIINEKTNFFEINKKIDMKVSNRETARIIKDSFEKQNNIIEANRFYALEMEERDDELSWKSDFKEKVVFKFHEWSSEHSQNWILVLFWILVFSMGYSLMNYSLSCDIRENTLSSIIISFLFIFNAFPLIIENIHENKELKKFFLAFVFLIIGIYVYITNDLLLEMPAKAINPFSLMDSTYEINGLELMFKVVIAYLIYQLIISVRQNTRRK